jgi:SH3-like domain-containing protein
MNLGLRCLTGVLIVMSAGIAAARADTTGSIAAGSASGLPVPRFVSLKADKVNMHIGPAKHYEVKWLYQRAGLPVEITAEFENWRRIRDSDGTEGWVYHSLLSGRRTGVVMARSKDDMISLHERPDAKSSIAAHLQPGVQGSVRRCTAAWCRVTGPGFDGWVPQERLWGVYPNEKVD